MKMTGEIIAVILAGIVCVLFLGGRSSRREESAYEEAQEFYENREYESALSGFEKLGDYADASGMAEKCRYRLSADGRFLETLSEALSERWDAVDADEAEAQFYSEDAQIGAESGEEERGIMEEPSPGEAGFGGLYSGGMFLKRKKAEKNADLPGEPEEKAGGPESGGEDGERIRRGIYCEIELGYLAEFDIDRIADASLRADARSYLNCLREAEALTEEKRLADADFENRWAELYRCRRTLICRFAEKYGLAVDEEHEVYLDAMRAHAAEDSEEKIS